MILHQNFINDVPLICWLDLSAERYSQGMHRHELREGVGKPRASRASQPVLAPPSSSFFVQVFGP